MQITPVRKGPSEQLGVPCQAMECRGELRLVYGGLGQWTGPLPPSAERAPANRAPIFMLVRARASLVHIARRMRACWPGGAAAP
jgi:hypothetical protein